MSHKVARPPDRYPLRSVLPPPTGAQRSAISRNDLAAAHLDAQRLSSLAMYLYRRLDILSLQSELPGGVAERALKSALEEIDNALANVRFEVWKAFATDRPAPASELAREKAVFAAEVAACVAREERGE